MPCGTAKQNRKQKTNQKRNTQLSVASTCIKTLLLTLLFIRRKGARRREKGAVNMLRKQGRAGKDRTQKGHSTDHP